MHASESSTPIADRPARAGAASVAVVLLAAVTACVPLRRVTVDVPVTLAPNATATASLPGPANYVDRAARVRLRFADAPLRSRGGASWNYTVDFTVTPLINGAPAGTPQASSLTVYRGMDRESFESLALVAPLSADGVQVAVTAINSVDPTALPADLKLNLELSGVRAVEFARKKKPSISLLNGPTLGVVMTSIPDGTVSYEFEWVFYDRQETKPAEPFANRDPVRIASATPLTLIDTSYPDGALYVRARAIGRHGTAMAESAARRTGQWSNVLRIPLTPGGLEPESNWKYTAAYAEDLGLASGIEYFDGAYRSRQRQSRALTQDARVVAETKYDGEGRPVLTFLPAPTDGTRLTHADAFNTVDTPGGATPTGAYGTAQFEGGPPARASTTSGAGQYYSGSASIRAPTDAYVADARGYPYSIVERARDNSGRQRRRSGTGEPLRLGGGHEALVRYGTASSSALRRLFGANVGQAAYYDRNVVIDPNRRAEVNYVDRSGNVIASAVAGTTNSLESIAPANLPLLTYRLDENNIVDAHAGVSRSVNRISVEYGTDLFFSYDVNGAQYTVPASGPFPRLCESCRYRLRVRITGPSGDLVSVRESATPQSDPSCDSAPLRSEIARDVGDTAPPPNFCTAGAAHSAVTATSPTQTQVRFCAKFTEPGEYEVVKELTLIDGAVEAIVNTVFSTPGTFDINTFRPDATIIDRQCPGDCAAFCSNVDTEHRQQCVASCRQPLDWAISAVANESCKSLEEEIKADVGPRGILKATALIDHPEYCHIFKASPVTPSLCQRTIASNVFDYRMMSVHTWNEALCRGYLDPLQGTPGAPARPATCPGLPERDPITDPTQIGVSMRGWMIAALQDYTGNMPGFSTLPTQQPPPAPPPPAQPHLSIWQAATLPIYPSTSPPSDDERWRMFRSLYIGVKQTAIVKYMEDPNGGNCPYWNDRHAHVKRPYTFTTTQDAQDTAAGERDYYCASLCNSRAAQWIADLETECEVTIPGFYKSQRLAPGLREYCRQTCSETNPLPLITSDAVSTNQWLVQAVQPTAQYQLPATCTLNRIARAAQQPPTPGQGPISIGNYAPALGDRPGDVIANVVDPDFQFPRPMPTDLCKAGANEWADQLALIELEKAKSELWTFVEQRHHNHCFGPKLKEAFRYQARQGEYQFTLRYHDQAGSLVQTVPPAGVRPLTDGELADLESGLPVNGPGHKLLTQYRYNSLGEVLVKQTPDGGEKKFWYNTQGQLRLSQNAQQQLDGRHAYVRYDDRGRIVETGLVANPADANGVITPLDPALLPRYVDDRNFPEPGYTREQVASTAYDAPAPECSALAAQNLRGRVAAIVADTTVGAIATCYSYDVHGNIAALAHTVPGLGTKTVTYEYDLLDGRLRASHYQAGAGDALHHRYTYDVDRRLATVETSRDGELWERDAAYSYYRHGPMARIELGADRVQGLDYLYAITNWPKGINSDTLSADRDPGGDGRANAANAVVARDAFGSAVHYFPNDYVPAAAAALGGRVPQAVTSDPGQGPSALTSAACTGATASACGLYDGSVTGTVSTIPSSPFAGSGVLGTAYRYDQLYRLRASKTFADLDRAANRWPSTSADLNLWRTETRYDANGNIDGLKRYAPAPQGNAAQLMDDLTYGYPRDSAGDLTSNRLLRVADTVAAGDYPDDLDTQPPDNYSYDANGRPTRDGSAGLNAIHWNAAGQIATIDRLDDTVEFVYDGLGRRVAKIVRAGNDPTRRQYEYFVRDAKGETLATYKSQAPAPGAPSQVVLQDQTLLGSGRLGIWTAANTPTLTVIGTAGGGGIVSPPGSPPTVLATLKRYSRVRGDKQYELANYLGNVEVTIRDRKTPIETSGTVTGYQPQLVNTRSYYPFGAPLPEVGTQAQTYRFGFSGFERDDELRGSGNSYYTQARMFDPRIGRWLSPDSLDTPGSSPFVAFANNPLRYSDPQGTDDKDSIKLQQLKAAIAADLRSRDFWQRAMRPTSAEVAARERALGPQLYAADPPGLVRVEKFGIGTDKQNEMMQSAVQVPLVAASVGYVAGPAGSAARAWFGGGALMGMNGANLGMAIKSGDPVNIGLAGLGVLADAYMVSKVPAPPREWKMCSFTPDTPVVTARGLVPISEIHAGDQVVSFDEATGKSGLRRVDLSYSGVHASSLRLVIRDDDGDREELVTTIEHPFWIGGNGWTPAGRIAAGTRVLGLNGWRTVERVELIPGDVRTFNLTIDDLHTFLVGTDGVWVHNACPWEVETGEWAPFEDAARPGRSVPGDELQLHELWSHANIRAHGLAGARRLSSPVSRANPVIALDDANHYMVNELQRLVDVTKLTPFQDITRNAKDVLGLGLSTPEVVRDAKKAAIDLAKSTGKLHQVPP